MCQVEIPWESENPAAVSAGGERAMDQQAPGGTFDAAADPAPDALAPGTAAANGKQQKDKKQKGKKQKKGLQKGAPAAQEFSPEMLEQLGLGMQGGSLVEIEVPIPAGVTAEMVERCAAMGFNRCVLLHGANAAPVLAARRGDDTARVHCKGAVHRVACTLRQRRCARHRPPRRRRHPTPRARATGPGPGAVAVGQRRWLPRRRPPGDGRRGRAVRHDGDGDSTRGGRRADRAGLASGTGSPPPPPPPQLRARPARDRAEAHE